MPRNTPVSGFLRSVGFTLLLTLITLVPVDVVAFGTINEPVVLGQHNEHEMITRLAFQCLTSNQRSDGICFEPRSLDQLAGYHLDLMGLAVPGAGFNGAVGAPDTLDPVPEGPEAHCDDADFVDIPGYPQTREQANENLQKCVDHLRERFHQAVVSAADLVDERNRIRRGTVELGSPTAAFGGGDCRFAFSGLVPEQINTLARPKCSVLEGFGRALHGVQDFYSHSNWGDLTDTSRPISAENPPGLGMEKGNITASFLDLRARGKKIDEKEIPWNLTTGCFNIPDTTPGSGTCEGRVTHHALNKDHGVIYLNESFGEVGVAFSLRASVFPENFYSAVRLAVRASREAWGSLRDELRERYGVTAGNLMICALVRDDPVKDCRMRTVAVVMDDHAIGMDHTVVGELERDIARELNARLMKHEHGLDRIEIIEIGARNADVDSGSLRVVYPMGYPESAVVFDDEHDSSESAFPSSSGRPPQARSLGIGHALELAINDSIAAQPETYTDRAAVVMLTTGFNTATTRNTDVSDSLLAQVNRAWREGIRIHYACVNSTWEGCTGGGISAGSGKDSESQSLIIPSTVLKTGGTFAILHPTGSSSGYASNRTMAQDFINLITHRGLAWTDEYLPDEDKPTRIYPGITLAVLLTSDSDSEEPELNSDTSTADQGSSSSSDYSDSIKAFVYPASAGEFLNFTIRDRTTGVLEPGERRGGGCFSITLLEASHGDGESDGAGGTDEKQDLNKERGDKRIAGYTICSEGNFEPLELVYQAERDITLNIVTKLLSEQGEEEDKDEQAEFYDVGVNSRPPRPGDRVVNIHNYNNDNGNDDADVIEHPLPVVAAEEATVVIEDEHEREKIASTRSSTDGAVAGKEAGTKGREEREIVFTIELSTNMPIKTEDWDERGGSGSRNITDSTGATRDGHDGRTEESADGTVVLVTTETETEITAARETEREMEGTFTFPGLAETIMAENITSTRKESE